MKLSRDVKFHKGRWMENGLIWMAAFFLILGAVMYIPSVVYVSTAVSERELPIYSVDTEKKQVALSFDAAWGNEDTSQLLSILAKHNVHATFFITGKWANSYPEDVKAILSAGHDLGNHSQNHKEMSKLSKKEIKEELISVHDKVKTLTGYDMFLFRPPYGDYNNQLITSAKDCGYYTIQWSVDSLDWKDYGIESIVKTVTQNKNLSNGAIILMHNNAKYTKDALETVITTLQQNGYEIVPISQLIYKDNYHMDETGKQILNPT